MYEEFEGKTYEELEELLKTHPLEKMSPDEKKAFLRASSKALIEEEDFLVESRKDSDGWEISMDFFKAAMLGDEYED